MSLGKWAHAIRTEEILSQMWLASCISALSLRILSSSFESAYSIIHCDTVHLWKFLLNFIILRISVLCKVPIHPVFPGTVLFLKEIFRCSENFSCDAQMSRFLIWYTFNSCHCNNTFGPYPTPMVNEFTVCYLWFRTCVCGVNQASAW